MKRTHITLPSLQVAATAFLALTCQAAAELYCVDKATSEVVAAENCEGDVGDFATVDGAPGAALGAVIAKRQDTDDDDNNNKSKRDLEFIAEAAAKLAELKLVAGGFGNGGACECSSSGEKGGVSGGVSGSSGGGGGGVVGWSRAGGGRGG
ncbi:hypothetical protein C8A01DRAFT_37262 [Parachaetomium inaequale]|uniref:Uncharacterized protein n=1 Tax=Parachaetomium inaequale TaxID=2588326 RepID=A0AAN6PEV0_9PEZI|nr:hypothetical protein C8A01DRAFT_37262 [Parachaetomium inaequale]